MLEVNPKIRGPFAIIARFRLGMDTGGNRSLETCNSPWLVYYPLDLLAKGHRAEAIAWLKSLEAFNKTAVYKRVARILEIESDEN